MRASLSSFGVTLLWAAIAVLLIGNAVVLAQPAAPLASAIGGKTMTPLVDRHAAISDDPAGGEAATPIPPPAEAPTPPDPPPPAADLEAVEPDVAAFTDAAASSGPTFPERIRGVWVHVLDDVLLSPASIVQMLDNVVAGGGNTVIVEVGRRHDVYYDSAFLPKGHDPGYDRSLDVLAEVIDGANARGLSVHAWYTAMPAWTPESARTPDPPNWTFTQHGRDVPPEQSWLTYDVDGNPSDFLDPGHPAVQDLVVAVAAELARYDIDAVHIDYLRYPGKQYGYNPVALGRFQAETGRTDIPHPDDAQFGDWRRQQTTDTMRRIRQAVTEVDPTVGVSVALIAWGDGPHAGRPFEATPAWWQVFQPWPQWMAEGLMDVAMPMIYFREARHPHYHRNWNAFAAAVRDQTGVMTAPGQGSWLNTTEQSLAQIADVGHLLDGEVLFSYQQTAAGPDPKALLTALGQSLWTQVTTGTE